MNVVVVFDIPKQTACKKLKSVCLLASLKSVMWWFKYYINNNKDVQKIFFEE